MVKHATLPLAVATGGLTPSEKLVYLHIYGMCQHGRGWAWCKNSHLADVCGISERQVRRILARLIELGMVERSGETWRRNLRTCSGHLPDIDVRSDTSSGHTCPEVPDTDVHHKEKGKRSARAPKEARAHNPKILACIEDAKRGLPI